MAKFKSTVLGKFIAEMAVEGKVRNIMYKIKSYKPKFINTVNEGYF